MHEQNEREDHFVPVILFGIQPSVLVVAPSKGWKSVADLVAAAKANPDTLNFASAGIGSASHMAGERLRLAANIKVQHIPFRGPVEALTEVMAGRELLANLFQSVVIVHPDAEAQPKSSQISSLFKPNPPSSGVRESSRISLLRRRCPLSRTLNDTSVQRMR
jgi:tripartite-type tricarboxylate transporter receptor subunit TctC